MAWYLSYVGEDEEAKRWSDTYGGELAPSRVINHLGEVEIKERFDYTGKYKRIAGYELTVLGGEDEDGNRVRKRKKTVYIFQCKGCNYKTESEKKNFGERYIHAKCGQEKGHYQLIDTLIVEE